MTEMRGVLAPTGLPRPGRASAYAEDEAPGGR